MQTRFLEPVTRCPVTIVTHMATPCIPLYLPVVSTPHTYLVAQPIAPVIALPAVAQTFPFNSHPGHPTHPFGTTPDVSNTLADLSSEELDFLNASFPTSAGDDVFGHATHFSAGVDSFDGMFADNPLGFAVPDTAAQLPSVPTAPTQPAGCAPSVTQAHVTASTVHNSEFNAYNTLDESIGVTVRDLCVSYHNAAGPIMPPTSSAPSASLAPTVPHNQSHEFSASGANQALSVPHDESDYPTPGRSLPHLQVATPRRSVSAPEIPGLVLPDDSRGLTPTCRSSRPYSPAANQPRSTPSTSTRAALLVPLPATPRAFGPNPLSRSFSTPLRGLTRNTPAVGSFRSMAHLNLELASAHDTRAGTPCPSSSHRGLQLPDRVPLSPFQGSPSSPHSPLPASPLPASPLRANTPRPTFSDSPAHSLRRAPLPPSPSVPHESVNAPGSPIAGGVLDSNAHSGELGGSSAFDFGENLAHEVTVENQPRGQPARHHRVRTPPPLARAFTRTLLLEADAGNLSDDDMTANLSEVMMPRVQLVAPVTNTIPSTTELAMNKAKEIQAICKARKSNEKPDADPSKSGQRVSSFKYKEPGVYGGGEGIYAMGVCGQSTLAGG